MTGPNEKESFAALFEASRAAPVRGRVTVGQELDVKVVRIGRDAIFVELDGKQEGFIEAKELKGSSSATGVVVGTRMRARVVEMGGRAGAARLVPLAITSLDSEADPAAATIGSAVVSDHVLSIGARVKGTVASVERYGVFMTLSAATTGRPPRGLIPTAELGLPRGADLRKAFAPGQPIEAKIIAIDERGRIRLSVAALAADDERAAFTDFEARAKKNDAKPGAPRGFGTLGDLLTRSTKKDAS